jgi:hypothetical protein
VGAAGGRPSRPEGLCPASPADGIETSESQPRPAAGGVRPAGRGRSAAAAPREGAAGRVDCQEVRLERPQPRREDRRLRRAAERRGLWRAPEGWQCRRAAGGARGRRVGRTSPAGSRKGRSFGGQPEGDGLWRSVGKRPLQRAVGGAATLTASGKGRSLGRGRAASAGSRRPTAGGVRPAAGLQGNGLRKAAASTGRPAAVMGTEGVAMPVGGGRASGVAGQPKGPQLRRAVGGAAASTADGKAAARVGSRRGGGLGGRREGGSFGGPAERARKCGSLSRRWEGRRLWRASGDARRGRPDRP